VWRCGEGDGQTGEAETGEWLRLRRSVSGIGRIDRGNQVRLSMYRTIREGHLDVVSKDLNTLTGQSAEGFTSYLTRRLEEF
tara:strand:+ start:68 stop:310 length:243 start_codon:yes stop_codon:yes gene_type:complete